MTTVHTATSSATCDVKSKVEQKKRVEQLLSFTRMSLTSVTNDSMQSFIKEGRDIYMSFTDKLESLREVRDAVRTEYGDRTPEIDMFITEICRDDVESLAQAISDGNVKRFQGFMDLGVSPAAHPSGDEENSLLQAAIAKGHGQIVQMLLPYSSNRNLLDSLRVLLLMAAKEPAWNRFVPMARSLVPHLQSWEATEKQITRCLDQNREKLDAEALIRAKGFHQATFAHLKARKSVDESKARARPRESLVCDPSDIVKCLAKAVRNTDADLHRSYPRIGVRLTETAVGDSSSPLDIAVEIGDAEVFQLLLPHSDERIAVNALMLIIEKVIASPDWHKWVPWGRQTLDHMTEWKRADEQFAGLIKRKINDSNKPLGGKALIRVNAFRNEVFAYFRSPLPGEGTSVADHAPINTAGATHTRSTPPESAIAADSDLTGLAKSAYVESVDF